MVDFPASLPQSPLIDGFDATGPDIFISSQPDTGPQIRRKRYTAAPEPIKWPLMLTFAQWATLKQFYKDSGASPFNMTDPLTNTTQSYRFKGKPPNPQPVSHNLLKVILELEMMP